MITVKDQEKFLTASGVDAELQGRAPCRRARRYVLAVLPGPNSFMVNPTLKQVARKPGGSLPTYRAYLMRCWQERNSAPDGEPIWRFSLDASWYEERRGFVSLQALMEHLQTELMSQDTSPEDE